MDSQLTHQIAKLLPGDHLCVFYNKTPAEQMPALTAFIREGLSTNEQFIYIADDHAAETLEGQLDKSGIDVVRQRDCGQLQFLTKREWRQWGESCARKRSLQLLELIDESVKRGFKGSRLLIEMSWTLGSDITPSQFMQWENHLNDVSKSPVPARIVCQYDFSRLSPETILLALRNHPLAVIDDEVYPSWFYHAASTADWAGDALGIDWIVSILQHSREAQTELELAYRKQREMRVLAAIGTAVQQIAHDMTNPLNAISTTIQLQERYLEKRSDRFGEQMSGALRDLKDETNRIRDLIDELRHFSKPLQLKLEATNLCGLLREVAREAVSSGDHSSRIQLEQALPSDDPPSVMADGEKLRCVLLSLCKNTIEAMPEGSRLTLKCAMQENNICLEIKHDGSGLSAKDFGSFDCAKPTGWGLNLATAQQIISAHKGVIEHSSEPNRGTIFKISLPLSDQSGSRSH
jgi:signal transduction histidine kinase